MNDQYVNYANQGRALMGAGLGTLGPARSQASHREYLALEVDQAKINLGVYPSDIR